jgi:hypothetical protein
LRISQYNLDRFRRVDGLSLAHIDDLNQHVSLLAK